MLKENSLGPEKDVSGRKTNPLNKRIIPIALMSFLKSSLQGCPQSMLLFILA